MHKRSGRLPVVAARGGRSWALAGLLAAVALGTGSSYAASVVGPPVTAATLVPGSAGAVDAVRAAVAGAEQAVAAEATLFGAGLFIGGGAARAVGSQPAASTARAGDRMLTCQDLLGPALCVGRARLQASYGPGIGDIPAGAIATLDFEQVRTLHDSGDTAFDGRMTMRFETALEGDSARWTTETLTLRFDGFSGQYAGIAFGPVRIDARLELDARRGVTTTTIGGVRVRGLSLCATTDGAAIDHGSVRLAHPAQAGAYVDASFRNWVLTAGRPVAGSTATVSAAGGEQLQVSVVASDAGTVVYAVTVQRAGVPQARYRVTARYADRTPTYDVDAG